MSTRRVKILATLGPSSAQADTLATLLRAGVDGIRLNFSHGTAEEHRANAHLVRRVAAEVGRPVAILADLSGPKIRTGRFMDGAIELVEGREFSLTTDPVPGDERCVSMSYPLADDLTVGDVLLLDDGLLRLRVERIEPPMIVTRVEVGGTLSNNKGINVPGARLKTPAMTEKDHRDVLVAREIGVDFVALSFVRTGADVRECKASAGSIPVIAKLEKPEAVANLDEIVAEADGLMVARGDLGVEIGSEKVPLVQKRAIRAVNAVGKLVITATQMLDSMMRNPRPTRAEATDVANAVLDGTDVVMLSGETASGKYPVEAVRTMDSIIREVEGSSFYSDLPEPEAFGEPWTYSNACGRAAASVSRSVRLAALVVGTRDGHTADIVADYRPSAPIVAVASNVEAARRLALQWGVTPVLGDLRHAPLDDRIARAEQAAVGAHELGVRSGDTIAIVVGGSLTLHTVT